MTEHGITLNGDIIVELIRIKLIRIVIERYITVLTNGILGLGGIPVMQILLVQIVIKLDYLKETGTEQTAVIITDESTEMT